MIQLCQFLCISPFLVLPAEAAYTLENIDPTTFNFIMDVVFEVLAAFAGMSACYFYGVLISFHVQQGHTVPITVLGTAPFYLANAAWNTVTALGWSAPMALYLMILSVKEASHALGDLGIDFVTTPVVGLDLPVLDLSTGKRNSQILFETMGETTLLADTFIRVQGQNDPTLDAAELQQLALRIERSTTFIAATDGIARGESQFLSPESRFARADGLVVQRNLDSYAGLGNPTVLFAFENDFLAGIDLALPLDCQGSLVLKQFQGLDERLLPSDIVELLPADNLQDFIIENIAVVPNCTINNLRPSGIFETHQPERAEVTAYVNFVGIPRNNEYGLVQKLSNGEKRLVQQFSVTRQQRALARYRPVWQQGRVIDGFTALQVGNVNIALGRVVLALGADAVPLVRATADGTQRALERQTEYALIGEVAGDCPLDPIGQKMPACMTITTIACESFPEDFTPSFLLNDTREDLDIVPEMSICTVRGVEVLWGRNFDADAQLISTVAGLFARNQKVLANIQRVYFAIHAIPAALFTLGTLETLPSAETPVRPAINGLFVLFLILPLVVGVTCLVAACYYRKSRLPIPSTPWEVFVLGSEMTRSSTTTGTALLPPLRETAKDKFPPVDTDLRVGLLTHRQGGGDTESGGSSEIRENANKNTELVVEKKGAFSRDTPGL